MSRPEKIPDVTIRVTNLTGQYKDFVLADRIVNGQGPLARAISLAAGDGRLGDLLVKKQTNLSAERLP